MALLGTLLRGRRPEERNHAWNHPRLAAPETIEITSHDFVHDHPLGTRHVGKRVGGDNISPHLAWSEPPAATVEFLLLVEDVDAPLGANPPVHCSAIVDPVGLLTPNELPAGALGRDNPASGVTLLRPTIGRGYVGPEPLKGNGIHRYVFEIYALGESLLRGPGREALVKSRPRALVDSLGSGVLARGRITGTYER